MRVFLLVLLIALTPLRSWAADTMAIQMASPAGTHAAASTHPDDCMHGLEITDAHDTDEAAGHCANCPSCQACFTVALIAPAISGLPQQVQHPLRAPATALFTSAERLLGQKPPIS